MDQENIPVGWKTHFLFIIGLALVTIIYFFQFIGPTVPARDMATYYLPNAMILERSWEKYGDLYPLWNPYGFSGEPFLIKPIIGFDSPLGLFILMGMSPLASLKLSYILFFLIAGVAMYFFTTSLNLEPRHAFLSALVYMLNGYVASLLVPGWLTTLAGYSLLPLVLLFTKKAVGKNSWLPYSVAAAATLSLILRFGPDMKAGLFVLLAMGLFMVYSVMLNFTLKKLVKVGAISFVVLSLFFAFSAERVLSHYSFMRMEGSSKASQDWDNVSGRQLSYGEMFTELVEPFKNFGKFPRQGNSNHIGIVAFSLALIGLFANRKNKAVLFLGLLALFAVLVASNTFNLFRILWQLPVFNSMRYMDRILILYAFSGSVLAGFGIQALSHKFPRWKGKVSLAALLLVFINLFFFGFSHYDGKVNEWTNIDEAVKENQALQFISSQEGIFRINTMETKGIDWGTDVFNVPLGLEHIFMYDTKFFVPYLQGLLSRVSQNASRFLGLLNVKYVTSQSPLDLPSFHPVGEYGKCTVCFPQRPELQKAWGPFVYENEGVLPRAYVVPRSILFVGDPEFTTKTIYSILANSKFNPKIAVAIKGKESINTYSLRELQPFSLVVRAKGGSDASSVPLMKEFIDRGGTLIPDPFTDAGKNSTEQMEDAMASLAGSFSAINDSDIQRVSFDKVKIALRGQKGVLVLSEKFSVFDGWKVQEKNGNELPLLNANGMNSAVFLDGNEQELTFTYLPLPFLLGKSIIGLAFFMLLGYASWRWFRRLKGKSIQAGETEPQSAVQQEMPPSQVDK
ncbi:hypothetical protein HYV84_01895 [Candidatus Woesearchaeota archaeon]|nr:hypothetical protein [Candidatus Woesearchaeota archaeon]